MNKKLLVFRTSGLDRYGHWKNDSLLDRPISEQFQCKIHVFSDSVLCLCEKILIILKRQEYGKPIQSATSSKVQNIDLSTTSQFARGIRTIRGTTSIDIPGCIKDMFAQEGVKPSQVNERILFMSTYNDID